MTLTEALAALRSHGIEPYRAANGWTEFVPIKSDEDLIAWAERLENPVPTWLAYEVIDSETGKQGHVISRFHAINMETDESFWLYVIKGLPGSPVYVPEDQIGPDARYKPITEVFKTKQKGLPSHE